MTLTRIVSHAYYWTWERVPVPIATNVVVLAFVLVVVITRYAICGGFFIS